MLSPFTWWNDAFVNLPLAYIIAGLFNKLLSGRFLPAFLTAYWLTNLLGIILMYIGASGLFSIRGLVKNKIWVVLITVIIYSIISAFLIGAKIIKPF